MALYGGGGGVQLEWPIEPMYREIREMFLLSLARPVCPRSFGQAGLSGDTPTRATIALRNNPSNRYEKDGGLKLLLYSKVVEQNASVLLYTRWRVPCKYTPTNSTTVADIDGCPPTKGGVWSSATHLPYQLLPAACTCSRDAFCVFFFMCLSSDGWVKKT